MATIVSSRTEQFFLLSALCRFPIALQREFDCIVTELFVMSAMPWRNSRVKKIKDASCLALGYKSKILVSLRVIMPKHHYFQLSKYLLRAHSEKKNNSLGLNKGNNGLHGDLISDLTQFSSQFQFQLRRYFEHSRPCLIRFPNTSKFVKHTPLRVVFFPLFS